MEVGSFHSSSTASPKSLPLLAEHPGDRRSSYRLIAAHIGWYENSLPRLALQSLLTCNALGFTLTIRRLAVARKRSRLMEDMQTYARILLVPIDETEVMLVTFFGMIFSQRHRPAAPGFPYEDKEENS